MNCIIKDKQTGLKLASRGISYEPNFFETDYFKKEFGDWVNGEVTGPRVYEDGSPRIEFNDAGTNAFYTDKEGFQQPIFNVPFSTLPPGNRAEISNGFVDQLIVDLFQFKDFIGKDIDAVLAANFNLSDFVRDQFSYYIKQGVSPEITASLRKDQDDYEDLLERRLRSIGLNYTGETETIDEYSGEAIVQAASFQRNTKDKATVRVKFLLNGLTHPDKNFEYVGKGNTGLPKAVSQAQAWAVILPILSNIPSLEDKAPIGQQIIALKQASTTYPWLKTVIETLEEYKELGEQGDHQGEIEIFNAFNNIKNKLNVTQITKKHGGAPTYTTMSAEEANRDYKFILKELVLNYRQKYFPNDEKDAVQYGALRPVAYKAIEAVNAMYALPQSAYAEGNYDARIAELNQAIGPFLTEIGMESSEELLSASASHWRDKTLSSKKEYVSKVQALKSYVGTLEAKITGFMKTQAEDLLITTNNPYTKYFEEVAKAEEDLRNDIGLHMVTLGKNRVYVYSLPTMIQERLNELKSGEVDIKEFQAEYPWLANSRFLTEWGSNSSKLNQTDIALRGVLQEAGDSRGAVDGGNISKGDYIKVDFFNVLRKYKGSNGQYTNKPIYNTQVPADKSREYQISTDIFMDTTRTEDLSNQFVGYIYDEITEMLNAKKALRTAITNAGGDFDAVLADPAAYPDILEDASQDLTMIYHLSRGGNIFEGNMFGGNAFKFGIFKALNNLNLPLFKNGVLLSDSLEEAQIILGSPEVTKAINATFSTEINRFKEIMKTLKLGAKLSYNKKSVVSSQVDADVFSYYEAKSRENGAKTPTELAAGINNLMARDYIANSSMSKIEFAKIFTGSTQYYKSDSDYIKRVPETYIDGIQLATGLTDFDEVFNQFTFDTESFRSELADTLPNGIKEYYENVDRTDAQGYITPDRWRFIMERSGKLGTEHKAIYNKMKAQWRYITKNEAIPMDEMLTNAEIKLLSAQPVKGVYFKNDPAIGPVYLKYSQAVLIPSIAQSTPKAKALLRYMSEMGIDEAVADTGIKVGAKKPAPLFNKEGEFIAPENPQIHSLDNKNWRLQQDLPTKTIKGTKIGTQIQKIIVSGLAFMGDTVMSNGMTGTELRDAINKGLAKLSDFGTTKMLKRYGIDGTNRITDIDKFYAPMIDDLEAKDNSSETLIEALKSRISLASLPQYARTVVSTFMGAMKKGAVDLLMPGGAFIQMSDQLIGKEIIKDKGIKMLVDFEGLKPPRVKSEGGRNIVKPGQGFIPHSVIAKLIPNYQNMSDANLRKAIPEAMRTIIGYRIPTQSRASTDLLEIVGILPPEMGDTIITYGEITAKTGSDFDIDKMFFMMQEMVMIGSKIELAKATDKDGNPTEKGVKNEVYSLFAAALKSNALYDSMMTSIDNDTIKQAMLDLLPEVPVTSNLGVFSPMGAIDTIFNYKTGAAGIGEWANANNDHIRSQDLLIKAETNVGDWGNEVMDEEFSERLTAAELMVLGNDSSIREIKIADSISELINAFVDIANEDAFITRANWGSMLNGYGGLLLRQGVHPHKVAAMFLQPAMSDFIKKSSYAEGVISNEPSWKILNESLEALQDKIKPLWEKRNLGQQLVGEAAAVYWANLDTSPLSTLYNSSVELEFQNFREMAQEKSKPVTLEDFEMQYKVLKQYQAHKEIVKRYNATVISSKWGENGAGSTPAQLLLIENKLAYSFTKDDKGLLPMSLDGLERKYIGSEGESTLLMTYYQNTARKLTDIFNANPSLFFGTNSTVFDGINRVSDENRVEAYLNSEEISSSLLGGVQSLALSGFAPFNRNYTQAQRDGLVTKVMKVKNNGDNFFLNSLFTEKAGDNIYFFMNRVGSKDGTIKDKLTNSWEQLLDDPKTADIAEFLVFEAYKDSGFRPGPNKFHELIPPAWMHKQGITEYVRNLDYNNLMEVFGEQFAQNNASNRFYKSQQTPATVIRNEETKDVTYMLINSNPRMDIGQTDYGLPIMAQYMHYTPKKTGKDETSGLDKLNTDYYPMKLAGILQVLNTRGEIKGYQGVYKAMPNFVNEEGVNRVNYDKDAPLMSTLGWETDISEHVTNNDVRTVTIPDVYYETMDRVDLLDIQAEAVTIAKQEADKLGLTLEEYKTLKMGDNNKTTC